MAVVFDQESYIETTKGMLKDWVSGYITNADIVLAQPEKIGDGFSLSQPRIYIEYNRSLNLDSKGGRRTGRGNRKKRKMLTYSIHIITNGDNYAVLERDRIAQKLEAEATRDYKTLAGAGIFDFDMRYLGSYVVRENVHLCRMEIYFEIDFIN